MGMNTGGPAAQGPHGLSAHSPRPVPVSAKPAAGASTGRPASGSLHPATALRAIRSHACRKKYPSRPFRKNPTDKIKFSPTSGRSPFNHPFINLQPKIIFYPFFS